MPIIDKEIAIDAPLEKIFNYVNKPSNLPQIWPSFIGVNNEELLPNGGYKFQWTYKMGGVTLEGTAEYTDFVANFWFTCRTYGAIDSKITWIFRSIGFQNSVILNIDYWVPAPLKGSLDENMILKMNEKEAELILENLRMRCET
jgi:uncharacterized membrane protein